MDGSEPFTVWLSDVAPALAAAAIREAPGQGNAVVLGNADPVLARGAALNPAHAYSVLALREAADETRLLLQNPTGESRARTQDNRSGPPGQFHLRLEEALQNFRFLDISGCELRSMGSLAPLQAAIDAAKVSR